MEARTGDSPPEKPVKGPVPLVSVTFTSLVPIPGFKNMATYVETGATRTDEGIAKQFPQLYLDPVLRTIIISGKHYPLERVVCFERARAALSKLPPMEAQPEYRIGKRVPPSPETKE